MENKETAQPQKQMTEAEMKAYAEGRQKEWEAFMKKLTDTPTATTTNDDLKKAIDFISEDMAGISQMTQMMFHNMNVLNKNFQQMANAMQGKSNGGIILPR